MTTLPWDLPWDRYGPEPSAEPELPPTVPVEVSPEPVSPPPTPPPPAPPPPVDVSGTPEPTDLVKADARSRSSRTLIQGLIFDLFAAIVASVALLSGADPFVKETWIGFGILLVKSVVSAAISYFMRLRSTPTARTKGDKYAIMPVPRPILETDERKRSA